MPPLGSLTLWVTRAAHVPLLKDTAPDGRPSPDTSLAGHSCYTPRVPQHP